MNFINFFVVDTKTYDNRLNNVLRVNTSQGKNKLQQKDFSIWRSFIF